MNGTVALVGVLCGLLFFVFLFIVFCIIGYLLDF